MNNGFIDEMINKDIEIKREDIIPYVYFVCSMANESQNGMYGGLGSKSDFIGGIFDRWINIIPESVVFNKCILPIVAKQISQYQEISVYSDFYKYDPKAVGIAPDVIGLKADDKIIPFVKYNDTIEQENYWVKQERCPLIEVKAFKEKDYMINLRNQNYSGKYLVMVNTKLPADYLLPFFNKELFSDENITSLNMPDDFIISNEKGLLENTKKFSFDKENLGTLRLLAITKADDFMNIATKCFSGQSPRYFYGVKERKINKKTNPQPFCRICTTKNGRLYKIDDSIFNTPLIKTLDISISDIDSVSYIDKTKNSIIIETSKDNLTINGIILKKGVQYNLEFRVLDRSSNGSIDETKGAGSEYFINKGVVEYIPNKVNELIEDIVNVLLD